MFAWFWAKFYHKLMKLLLLLKFKLLIVLYHCPQLVFLGCHAPTVVPLDMVTTVGLELM